LTAEKINSGHEGQSMILSTVPFAYTSLQQRLVLDKHCTQSWSLPPRGYDRTRKGPRATARVSGAQKSSQVRGDWAA